MRCPRCRSKDITKAGFDYTRKGKEQRYFCKSCRIHTIKPIMPRKKKK